MMYQDNILNSLYWIRSNDYKNYVHTHTRVWWGENKLMIYAEKMCINQYGSAYGLGEFASRSCTKTEAYYIHPSLIEQPNWADIEV